MNKLVIIGNGFDLAHGLKTSYKDFLLWEINEAFRTYKDHKIIKSPLFTIESEDYIYNHKNPSEPFIFKSIDEFTAFLKENVIDKKLMKVVYPYQFIKNLFGLVKNNWVDIEREYFRELVKVHSLDSIGLDSQTKLLTNLNDSVELIKIELEKYLFSKFVGIPEKINEINNIINNDIYKGRLKSQCSTILLNFNYTKTINLYLNDYLRGENVDVVNIHGQLKEKENPIIFGYGDESNDYYEKIEKLNQNEYLKHMKSFAYLQTANYRNLFEFLDKGDFEVYVIGHSLGLSDRLLFNHIFEHEKFKKVQLYFYEYENEEGDVENDFFQKTQELSRHFRKDAKHKMRKCIVPFNESKPLPQFKQQN